MPHLTELTVQKHAQKFLEKKLGTWTRKKKLFSQIEVRTKKEHGGKRADGLLAFNHWLLGTYVVSMEAKSHKTLPAMKPQFDAWFFIYNCLKAGIIISILSGAVFAIYKAEDPMMQYLIPMNAFLVGALLYGILTFTNYSHKLVPVVKQVGQYPANKQWLAFSDDSIDAMGRENWKNLKKICQARGIGILEVFPKGKVKLRVKAKYKTNWGRGFLYFYSKEKEIRKVID